MGAIIDYLKSRTPSWDFVATAFRLFAYHLLQIFVTN